MCWCDDWYQNSIIGDENLRKENNLGKGQSLFGIYEAVAPAIATPLYNKGNNNKAIIMIYLFIINTGLLFTFYTK